MVTKCTLKRAKLITGVVSKKLLTLIGILLGSVFFFTAVMKIFANVSAWIMFLIAIAFFIAVAIYNLSKKKAWRCK